MKEIDIQEISEKHWEKFCKDTSYEYFEEAIKDAVNQALDIASEEATTLPRTPYQIEQAILDVKKRIK